MTYKDLVLIFLKLGLTSFGGPVAHIAIMQNEFVEKRKWLTDQEFLDLVGASQLIPGPNSTEIAMHIGFKKAGYLGLCLAGLSFILPAFFVVWALAAVYQTYGQVLYIEAIFKAIVPVICAIILIASLKLSQTTLKKFRDYILLLAAIGLLVWSKNEVLTLFVVGFLSLIINQSADHIKNKNFMLSPVAFIIPDLDKLFFYFLKIGSILFGSGYVLISFLQNDLVYKYQWITEKELIDAIAIGQMTPGPVFTTATFIGYITSGSYGAAVATIGIFLPAFIFVALTAKYIQKIRQWNWFSAFLDGLNIASFCLIAFTAVNLIRTHFDSRLGVVTFAISFFLMRSYQINSVWLILAAGLFGLLV